MEAHNPDFAQLESSDTVSRVEGSNITEAYKNPTELYKAYVQSKEWYEEKMKITVSDEAEGVIHHKAFEEPVSVPMYNVNGELERVLEPGEKPAWQCVACHKAFVTKQSLERHKERHPLCKEWESREENKVAARPAPPKESAYEWALKILEENLSIVNVDKKVACRYCSQSFSNVGNLHKHFNTAVVCNKLAYMKIKEAFASSNPS